MGHGEGEEGGGEGGGEGKKEGGEGGGRGRRRGEGEGGGGRGEKQANTYCSQAKQVVELAGNTVTIVTEWLSPHSSWYGVYKWSNTFLHRRT